MGPLLGLRSSATAGAQKPPEGSSSDAERLLIGSLSPSAATASVAKADQAIAEGSEKFWTIRPQNQLPAAMPQ